ncbi:MAG: hypothetical protein ACODAF_04430 [Actinomycetota bacterium]
MRLSAAVMAHPARRPQVEQLLDRLDRDVPVAWARNARPSTRPRDRWDTGRRAWQAHDPAADWHLVLQDDALPVPDLLAGLEAALPALPPRSICSPYFGVPGAEHERMLRALQRAEERPGPWLRERAMHWGVAIAAPVESIPDMLAWCARNAVAPKPYDTRLMLFYRKRRYPCFFTWPSLVSHGDAPSLLGHRDGRRAHTFTGESALAWARQAATTKVTRRSRA